MTSLLYLGNCVYGRRKDLTSLIICRVEKTKQLNEATKCINRYLLYFRILFLEIYLCSSLYGAKSHTLYVSSPF